MKKYVSENEVCPWGYFPAYYDWPRHRAVCYPFGIHLIVAAFRCVFYWAMISTRSLNSRAEMRNALDAQIAERKAELTAIEDKLTTYRCEYEVKQ